MDTTQISVIIIGLILGYISTSGVKSQNIRILDIIVIGPLMIYFGYSYEPMNIFSMLLIFFGATTMTYNLKNYFYTKNWILWRGVFEPDFGFTAKENKVVESEGASLEPALAAPTEPEPELSSNAAPPRAPDTATAKTGLAGEINCPVIICGIWE